ncbi:hypothetical protein LTR09_000309 [Extremus antarcticus]|uniref:Uncharacterized protein n=1 Tax=Extremus antarcticus TaxID=702011 RepID=A0AAJ0GJE7_9PEZI|nr:hypothetical protein LTR09_000309 [Extremus antarcticus]
MAYFREAHRTALQDLKASQWTFGQILAVTIWAPPLVEYIRSAIEGVDEANEHRFVSPYRVVIDEDEVRTPRRHST